jgi:hypothetical protein
MIQHMTLAQIVAVTAPLMPAIVELFMVGG